jgi:hypothetical protein
LSRCGGSKKYLTPFYSPFLLQAVGAYVHQKGRNIR